MFARKTKAAITVLITAVALLPAAQAAAESPITGRQCPALSGAASDDAAAAEDLAAIVIPNAADIRGDIYLPAVGTRNGSTINWSSNRPDLIDTAPVDGKAPGVVTRPAVGSTAAQVVLTATATTGQGSATRQLALRIQPQAEQSTPTHYLFPFFTSVAGNNSWEEQIYFATSDNATHWEDLHSGGNPILSSDISRRGLRDPYLVRSPGGDKFYMIATDENVNIMNVANPRYDWDVEGSDGLIVFESTDLVDWSAPRYVDLVSTIPDSGMAWAPEAVWDEASRQYVVFWATSAPSLDKNGNDRPNIFYATTRDFVAFSKPVKWVDRNSYALDQTLIKVGDWWYRSTGEGIIERSKNLYAPTTHQPTKNLGDQNWSYITNVRSLAGLEKTVEGTEFFIYNPDDVQQVNGKDAPYGFLVDEFAKGTGYLPFRVTNPASASAVDWAKATDVDFGELLKRHGSVLPISTAEYEAIHSAFADDQFPNIAAKREVRFDTQGASPIAPLLVSDGGTVVLPNAPTCDTLIFTGWTTDPAGELPFDVTTPVTGDLVLYAHWSAPDTTRPVTTLISPLTAGPHRSVQIEVDAADDQGLRRIVANIYRGSTLVKSTQTRMTNGELTGRHTATVTLPDGEYSIRYNAEDLAGNISATQTVTVLVDSTPPTVSVKDGDSFTVGDAEAYRQVSFKLYDAGKIDRLSLNGLVKDLTDNPWSDLNFVKPGVFGANLGANTLVVYDVAGNSTTITFSLSH